MIKDELKRITYNMTTGIFVLHDFLFIMQIVDYLIRSFTSRTSALEGQGEAN